MAMTTLEKESSIYFLSHNPNVTFLYIYRIIEIISTQIHNPRNKTLEAITQI